MEYGKVKKDMKVRVHMDPDGEDYMAEYQDKVGTVECIGSTKDPLCIELIIDGEPGVCFSPDELTEVNE